MRPSTVDVLVPHFEDVSGLSLSLRSLEAQTFRDMRIVVADDGSSAACVEAVRALLDASTLKVELLRSATNQGRPRTRNVLLDSVGSPFVAWLDAGDIWYPRKLELQM